MGNTTTKFKVIEDFLLQKISGCGEGEDFKADEAIKADQEIIVSCDINQDYIFISISNEEPLKSGFSNLGFLIARGFIKQI